VSWRKYLLVPRLAATGAARRLSPAQAWESYWGAVGRTGPDGDVLWDGAGEQELAWWSATARDHLDPALPLLDVGCGNGRLSRLLAPAFPRVLGVDLSPAAIELARRESVGDERVAFEVGDVTADGAGEALAAELGPANVVVRGVLHVLDDEHRRRAARELATVLGDRGRLLLLETNWPGDLLGYLEHLGADHGRLPAVLARLIDHRLPRPDSFGPAELARTFPAPGWTTLLSGPVDIDPVRGDGPAGRRTIPGFSAVLRTSGAVHEGVGEAASELGA
jgi:SAM-dependent methyltransferase